MREEIKYPRRRFLGSAAMTIAAAKLAMISSADARANDAPQSPNIRPAMQTTFGSLKQIDAGRLECWLR